MADFLRCKDCKHDKGKCIGVSRRSSHKNCFEPKFMTNADRIRAMSDEELAKYLLDVEQGNFTIDCCDDRFCDTQNCCHDCTEAAIKWLKQPAEVEDNA